MFKKAIKDTQIKPTKEMAESIKTHPVMYGIGFKCFKNGKGGPELGYCGPSVSYEGSTPSFNAVDEKTFTLESFWRNANTMHKIFLRKICSDKPINRSQNQVPGLVILRLNDDGTPMQSRCYADITMSKDIHINKMDESSAKNFIDLALYIAFADYMNFIKGGYTVTGARFGRDYCRQWIRIFFAENLVGRDLKDIFHEKAYPFITENMRYKNGIPYASFKPYTE
jgi:hypothetical protein